MVSFDRGVKGIGMIRTAFVKVGMHIGEIIVACRVETYFGRLGLETQDSVDVLSLESRVQLPPFCALDRVVTGTGLSGDKRRSGEPSCDDERSEMHVLNF